MQWLWKLLAVMLGGMLLWKAYTGFSSGDPKIISLVLNALLAIAIYGYAWQKPLLGAWFWKVFFVLLVLMSIGSIIVLGTLASENSASLTALMLVEMIGALFLAVASLYGLFQYAFRCQAIWTDIP